MTFHKVSPLSNPGNPYISQGGIRSDNDCHPQSAPVPTMVGRTNTPEKR